LELTVPSSSRYLPRVRHAAARAMHGLPRSTVDDVLLVLDEAVSNAIRHGSAAGEPITVALAVDGGWVEVRVGDNGPTERLPRLPGAPPSSLATGGRGLWLIRQLADDVRLRRAGRGTLLWARCRVRSVARIGGARGTGSAR
jgi:anti-sigma regulatory factor (Ser/Thr protein kinase)